MVYNWAAQLPGGYLVDDDLVLLSPRGGTHQSMAESGPLPGFKAVLVFSTGLENSPCEEVEGLGRVSPILGLKKKALHCEDVVELSFLTSSRYFFT